MKVNVGSQNQTKLNAVADTLKLYPEIFIDLEVTGVAVIVDEFGHPKSLEETITGAIKRAKGSFQGCEYSFGIESGLFEVPYSLSGFMEIQACAIYDGKNIHLGFSPAFEWPRKVIELILSNKADGSAALRLAGVTDFEKVGAIDGGAMGLLTNGRLTREEQIKSSIISAMIQIERKELYL
jgi:inosine/xanthosine triphosphatase